MVLLGRNRVLDTLESRVCIYIIIKMYFLAATQSFTLFGDLQATIA